MALQIDFPDQTNGICENAYVVLNNNISNVHKNGIFELFIWNSEDNRKAGKRTINSVRITVRNEDDVFDNDGCIQSINYANLAWKTGAEFYTYAKTLKVKIDGETIDLSTAIDI